MPSLVSLYDIVLSKYCTWMSLREVVCHKGLNSCPIVHVVAGGQGTRGARLRLCVTTS